MLVQIIHMYNMITELANILMVKNCNKKRHSSAAESTATLFDGNFEN